MINLDLEEARGFSVPVDALNRIKNDESILAIINKITAASGSDNGVSLDEYLDEDQVSFGAQAGSYCGVFSENTSVDTEGSGESYSMVLYLSDPGNSFFEATLSELAEAFEGLGIEYIVSASSSTGDFEEGNPLIGPAGRIDASFDGVELHIVDDEICIE